MLRIGISACFFHSDPKRPVFKGKTLQYLEQSMAHWVLSGGVLAYMIPAVAEGSAIRLLDLALDLDGLVLQGGSDVAPQSYGEKPQKPEWGGDAIRDRYEIELVREFLAQDKPILGVCRGLQLINVALGGTLYQDIQTQVPGALNHRDWEIYDQNTHGVVFEKGGRLQKVFGGKPGGQVNTVHHQAIAKLGKGLAVEARSEKDGIIEAVRLEGDQERGPYLMAVQWHPEFQEFNPPPGVNLLPNQPILDDFIQAVRHRRDLA